MVVVRSNAQTVGALIVGALSRGETDEWVSPELLRAGDCERPVLVEMRGKAISDHLREFYQFSRNADLWVRCRACDACLKARARLWAARANVELQHWPRSWFGTLTLSPDEQFRARVVASQRLRLQGVEFEELPGDEQFRELVSSVGRDVTKFLKRVRAQAKTRVRYLLVSEAHKSGLPHFHLLVHESAAPVRKRVLQGQWSLGFSQWKLCDLAEGKQIAWYVSKYLTKSALTRVRASQRYGNLPEFNSGVSAAAGSHPSEAKGEKSPL